MLLRLETRETRLETITIECVFYLVKVEYSDSLSLALRHFIQRLCEFGPKLPASPINGDISVFVVFLPGTCAFTAIMVKISATSHLPFAHLCVASNAVWKRWVAHQVTEFMEGQQPGYSENRCGQSYSDNDFHLKIERSDSYLKMTARWFNYNFLFSVDLFRLSYSDNWI